MEVADDGRLGRIRHLHHKLLSVGGLQVKVLIALADQRQVFTGQAKLLLHGAGHSEHGDCRRGRVPRLIDC